MKICDRCGEPVKLKTIKFGDKYFDLCDNCQRKVLEFIKSKPNKNNKFTGALKSIRDLD